MKIPEEFTNLFPKLGNGDSDEPIYYLWVYNPQTDRVLVEHNEDKHKAEHVHHGELAKRVTHPERIHGYAYPIRGGFRITDWDHRPVLDPHVKELVKNELRGKKPRPHSVGSLEQRRAVK